jgi:hypothetical protein
MQFSSSTALRSRPRKRRDLGLRVRVLWGRDRLTRDLASGVDPESSPELQARASQLTARREVKAIACGLENVVQASTEPPLRTSPRVPFDREAVREASFDLLDLAQTLRDHPAPHPCGVAMAERMLTNYGSPLFTPLGADIIRRDVESALAALEKTL